MKKVIITVGMFLIFFGLAACQPAPAPQAENGAMRVMAAETFLADIAQQVAGERVTVEALMPLGMDPHAFQPTPWDVTRIAESDVFIVNGGGFEGWLDEVLNNAGGNAAVIEASAGLTSRTPDPSEEVHTEEEVHEGEEAHEHEGEEAHEHDHGEGDPHFWLDPLNVIVYVENIRDGLSQADPQGKETYAQNAAAYIEALRALDADIRAQVETISPERRVLVTNHESFGYFADRYGFTVAGAVIPSANSSAETSAKQLSTLIDVIRTSGAPAIFVETGANPKLAEQIAADAGVKVVTNLYTHSITEANGEAPSYLAMMRHNIAVILDALR
ncbi:metal ABC transporter substrate-binding protein [Levilinea saccharolytica]|uniref:metal ABC transporter substrate-binding protein n=1 Tax=Levilinea saccharolytica TaxID=229921 RepID=UPI000784EAFE|nr:zinc ABC transporter substrate-binding protein [Levilinea saccharolytica]GAP16329.1 ABC-type metal ion transport system, periplasmic component/surface adhesin [Levilinea saccharolytica]